MSIHRFSLSLIFFQIFLLFPSIISAIRNHIGLPLVNTTCRSTVKGRYLLTDDNGHVCDALSVDSFSHCCLALEKGEKFSCHGCNLASQCCNSYEYCVSCCQNPSRGHMSAYSISVLGGVVIIPRVSCTKMLITVITITVFLCRHMLQESTAHNWNSDSMALMSLLEDKESRVIQFASQMDNRASRTRF